ncbi:MAG: hypothetical protein M9955_17315 [Rhizobiaceae bacterium]|nr:hypothetical protein [Rhizobiaceae bacterium]
MAKNPAERFAASTANLRQALSAAFTDVHERLIASETSVASLLANQSDVVDSLVGQITQNFSELFTSADELVTAIRNADFLTATTATPVTFTVGAEATLLLDAGDSFPFVPSSVVGLSLPDNIDDYAFARVTAWAPSTRSLSIEIFAASGAAGPHTGVAVEIAAINTLAMEAMRAEIEAKRALIQGYATQIAIDRGLIHDDMEAIDDDRAAIAADKAAIILLKAAAEAAAAAAATFDPANFWTKAQSYSAAQIDALRSLDRDPLDRLAIQPVSYLDFSGDYAVASGWFTRSGSALSRKVNGLLASVAANTLRIDHAQGKVKGALLEPAATNLALHSQDLSDAAWAKVRCSISANTGLASDGATTLDKIVEDGTAGNTHVAEQSVNFGSAGYKTISVEAQAGERTWCYLSAFDSTSATVAGVYFDLANAVLGTVVSGSGVIERLDNGNCLISVSGNFAAGTGGVDIMLASGDGAAVYSGNGSSGTYFGEVQVEDGRAATSRIRTAGATATRNADVLTISGTDFSEDWNALECSVVIDFEVRTSLGASVAYIWSITDGTGGNLLGLRINGATGNLELIVLQAGSANAYLPVSAVAPGQRHRVAASFAKDAYHVSLNGGAVQSDTAGAMPAGLSQECIGHLNGGTHLYGGGHIRRRARYGKAIPAVDLPKVSAL